MSCAGTDGSDVVHYTLYICATVSLCVVVARQWCVAVRQGLYTQKCRCESTALSPVSIQTQSLALRALRLDEIGRAHV